MERDLLFRTSPCCSAVCKHKQFEVPGKGDETRNFGCEKSVVIGQAPRQQQARRPGTKQAWTWGAVHQAKPWCISLGAACLPVPGSSRLARADDAQHALPVHPPPHAQAVEARAAAWPPAQARRSRRSRHRLPVVDLPIGEQRHHAMRAGPQRA